MNATIQVRKNVNVAKEPGAGSRTDYKKHLKAHTELGKLRGGVVVYKLFGDAQCCTYVEYSGYTSSGSSIALACAIQQYRHYL